MSVEAATGVWLVLGGYLGFGLIIALLVLTFGGLRRLDVNGGPMPLRVRLLVAPGMAALWPLILLRLSGIRPKEDRA